jgi:hypothetical protein
MVDVQHPKGMALRSLGLCCARRCVWYNEGYTSYGTLVHYWTLPKQLFVPHPTICMTKCKGSKIAAIYIPSLLAGPIVEFVLSYDQPVDDLLNIVHATVAHIALRLYGAQVAQSTSDPLRRTRPAFASSGSQRSCRSISEEEGSTMPLPHR